MEKLKAFIISIGYGALMSVITSLVAFVFLSSWGHQQITLRLIIYVFLSSIVPFCVAVPAAGHILVRQKQLSQKALWLTSALTGLFVPWIALSLFDTFLHLGAEGSLFSFIRRALVLSVWIFPLTLILARVLIGFYMSLLNRFGLLASFRQHSTS